MANSVPNTSAASGAASAAIKVRYVSGPRKDQVSDVSGDIAKSLIEAGVAEAVAVNPDDLAAAMEAVNKSVSDQLAACTKQITEQVTEQVLGKVGKGLAGIKPRIVVGPDREDLDPAGGFKSLGEFALCVRKHDLHIGTDERIKRLATITKADGMNEGALGDGGALVPVQYADQLYRDVLQESVLFDKARKYPINLGNSLIIPVRKMTELGQTNGFPAGGSLGSWLNADGVAIAPAKPVYSRVQMTLNRWGTLLPVTDELLQDNNVALSNFIFDEGGIALSWDLNEAFIRGTGVSMPTGILNSGALVTVAGAQETGGAETTPTISYHDLVNLKSQLYTIVPGNTSSCVWIANPDCESQFLTMQDSSGRNIYYAAGTIQNQPKNMLLGIPVEYSYHCAPLGMEGDLILADMRQYFVSTRVNGGIETAMSMHLYFASAEQAFRIIYRIDGKTARTAPITSPNSILPRSGFVCLNTRNTSLS